MSSQPLARAAVLMLLLVVVSVTSWELFLRSKGFDNSFYDDGSLWADKRRQVYAPSDQATVFIGSSRIKFDLDIPLWEKTTGEQAIQLACVGSTPIPVLLNLADDEKFKGKLVIDVTEGLFFALTGSDERPVENIKYYKEETPAQRAGFFINYIAEKQFVFLDREWNSLGKQLEQLPLKDRKGVNNFKGFPPDFGRVMFTRQEYMTDKFAADTSLQNVVKNIWSMFGRANKSMPPSGKTLDSIFTVIKTATDKIKARGGKVLFIRTPSSDGFLMAEKKGFPREKYWNRLLEVTNCEGIHFEDYPVMAAFICPESSHLSLSQAKVFTNEFIRILVAEKGWQFSKLNTSAN